MRRLLPALLLALAACASKPKAAPGGSRLVPGELVVRASDASVLHTRTFAAALEREDVVVKEVECLTERICKVVLERLGAPADEAWTREVVERLSAAPPPGIDSVEANTIAHPKER
jgi:hypothetical protein